MKKSFIIFIALSITTTLFAQQPFGLNATWTIGYSEFGFTGYRVVTYSHDTIINGEAWQKFSEAGVQEIRTGPGPNDIIQGKYSGRTFDKLFLTINDSVFVKDTKNGTTELMFDFSASVGDKWQFAPWDTAASCLDTPQVTVVAIGYDTINGQAIKYWDLVDKLDTVNNGGNYSLGCSSGSCMSGRMYKDIGVVGNGFFYNFSSLPNLCNGSSFQLSTHWLRCYQDNSVNVNFTNSACDTWNWLSVKENSSLTPIKIYPNPAKNYLRLSGMENEKLTYKIYDVSGRVLLRGRLENLNDTIDIQLLSQGLYILELDNKKSLRFVKE